MVSRLTVIGAVALVVCLAAGAADDSKKVPAAASRPALKKQVYALHFPHHRTREHDGALGAWRKSLTAKLSKAEKTYFNYNPDLLDANGRHQIASTVYPYVGMQSELDPDYLEYQVLQAKVAHIDAFIFDWILPGNYGWEHTLKAMLPVAAKYDFKIGLDFIASSHYEWYQGLDPLADTREKKTQAIKKSLQYALDNFYSKPAALTIDDHPVLFLFGGTKPKELKDIRAHSYRLPKGRKDFWYVQRANVGWRPGDTARGYRRWAGIVDGCFGWILLPHRFSGKKTDPEILKTFDLYIDSDDIVEYVRTVIDKNDEYYRKGVHKIRVSSACPGFDNRGCAGWERTLALLPREKGQTFRKQWKLNVENRNKIDAVFLVTWNDYTEATSVEPTVEFGFDDMEVTQKYAAEFKGIPSDPSGVRLPAKLFKLRKRSELLARTGFKTKALAELLDRTAMAISNGKYAQAGKLLKSAQAKVDEMARKTVSEKATFAFPGPKIAAAIAPKPVAGAYALAKKNVLALRFDEASAKVLRENNFNGFLNFEYFDEGEQTFTVFCSPARPNVRGPRHVAKRYSDVCQIKKEATGKWVKARVKVFKVNAGFNHKAPKKSDFVFFGDVKVRNISFDFEVFRRR